VIFLLTNHCGWQELDVIRKFEDGLAGHGPGKGAGPSRHSPMDWRNPVTGS
jgi:hypothetical protein